MAIKGDHIGYAHSQDSGTYRIRFSYHFHSGVKSRRKSDTKLIGLLRSRVNATSILMFRLKETFQRRLSNHLTNEGV